jgi:hypothetical protein
MKATRLLVTLIVFITGTLLMAGCGTSIPADNAVTGPSDAGMVEPPYTNKEPDRYQTEIWQTSSRGVEKYLIIRDGTNWRIDSAYGSPDQVTTLHTDKDYVIALGPKVYAEIPPAHGFDERERMVTDISLGLINNRDKALFEKISSDGGVTKYKLVPDTTKTTETIVYFDEKAGLPMKKEIFKTDGGQRTLDTTVELTGFKKEPDAKLFALPTGFKKVPIEDMKGYLSPK